MVGELGVWEDRGSGGCSEVTTIICRSASRLGDFVEGLRRAEERGWTAAMGAYLGNLFQARRLHNFFFS